MSERTPSVVTPPRQVRGFALCTEPSGVPSRACEMYEGHVSPHRLMPDLIPLPTVAAVPAAPSVSTDGQTSAYMDPDAAFDEAHEAARIEDALATAQRWEGRANALDKALSAAVAELVGLRTEVDQLRTERRRCNAIGHPTVTPESLIPCQLDRDHDGDHYSTSGCSGGAVSWPRAEAERDAALARVDELRAEIAATNVYGRFNGREWLAGFDAITARRAAAVPVVGAEEPTEQAHQHCACFTHNNLPCCNEGHA